MAEVRRIIWSLEASLNFDSIINYLENRWTEKELEAFSNRLKKQLVQIATSPEICKISSRKQGLRECYITGHNTLFYRYDDESVYIVTIFDNRQDPEKLRKLS